MQPTLEILTHPALAPVRHGFFTRKGGASSGLFSGLNCGRGSSDQQDAVAVNRSRVADAMGVAAGRLATAIARVNPGMRANMMRITTDRQGWLDEVWICMDKRFQYARCPAHQGGLADNATLKLWRGRR